MCILQGFGFLNLFLFY